MTNNRKGSRLLTDTAREILHSKKRFLSLFVMSFLAVGFLAGLRMTAPDMQTTLDHYYDRLRFMDLRIVSMLGLTEEDLQAVSGVPGVLEAEGSYTLDALSGEECVNLFSVPEKINLLELMEGRMPQAADECVTEVKMLEALHKEVGDTITIDTRESFNRVLEEDPLAGNGSQSTLHTYTIVGVVRSPLYISRTRGSSSVGSGNLTGYVVLPRECFNRDVYSTIYLRIEGLEELDCYRDDSYIDRVDAFADGMKPLARERARIRREQVSRDVTFTDMMAAVVSGIAESGSSEAGALASLEASKGDWYILSRETIRSYVEFTTDAERMSDLADVFPLIFFLVAALSSLTTMTRMVEDHRAEIGTLKALGFSTRAISIKYIGYALLASLTGGGAGLLFGGIALPSLIYYEWGILYFLPRLEAGISPVVALYSLGSAVLATAGAAYAACYATLLERPAELLRPRAPKPGKRVFLENIKPVWSRLSFIQKVSVRNLFRYKKRFWMTIIGIAGCTALLVTGFGLRDSIFDVLDWQFDDLMPYNMTITLSSDMTPADRSALMEALEKDPGIGSLIGCYEKTISVKTEHATVNNVIMKASTAWSTPARQEGGTEQQGSAAEEFLLLYPRADGMRRYGKVEELPYLAPTDDTVVIDEKMSDLLEAREGDTITLVDTDEAEYEAVVGAVCENYVNHHLFITATNYKRIFGSKPRDNLLMVKTTDANGSSPEETAERISAMRGVLTCSRIDETRDHFYESMQSLDIVVWIIILAAAMLAFLVLFNLTNINVTERVRELATLKVLGFYDGETASYVYRENIFLTLMGAALGLFMGKGLHRWLISTIEMEYMIFGRGLHARSYLYAVILTVVFSLSVNIFSFFYIRKIDMVESLKSVE